MDRRVGLLDFGEDKDEADVHASQAASRPSCCARLRLGRGLGKPPREGAVSELITELRQPSSRARSQRRPRPRADRPPRSKAALPRPLTRPLSSARSSIPSGAYETLLAADEVLDLLRFARRRREEEREDRQAIGSLTRRELEVLQPLAGPRQPGDRRPASHQHPYRAQPRRAHPQQARRPAPAPGVLFALRYRVIEEKMIGIRAVGLADPDTDAWR